MHFVHVRYLRAQCNASASLAHALRARALHAFAYCLLRAQAHAAWACSVLNVLVEYSMRWRMQRAACSA
eukprot:3067955-Pleurochrysis_carterae.AAC.6